MFLQLVEHSVCSFLDGFSIVLKVRLPSLFPRNRNLKLLFGRQVNALESGVEVNFGSSPTFFWFLLDVAGESWHSFDESDCFQLPVLLQKLVKVVIFLLCEVDSFFQTFVSSQSFFFENRDVFFSRTRVGFGVVCAQRVLKSGVRRWLRTTVFEGVLLLPCD